MRKELLFVVLLSLSLSSCSSGDEDVQEVTATVNNNDGDLMPARILKLVVGFEDSDPVALDYYQRFTYNSLKKLVKVDREQSNQLSQVYLNLNYSGNTVTVENRSYDSNVITPKNTIVYTLNNNGKVIEKYVPSVSFNGQVTYGSRRYYYEYDGQNKLQKVILKYPDIVPGTPSYHYLKELERVDLFFYEGNNLKRIVSQSAGDYNSNSNIKRETVFSDYDMAKNPFKKLELIEFYFYRSLSENNYRNMKIYNYDEEGTKTLFSEQGWNFRYDHNNQLLLSDY
ncbi:hypothetical protein [Chryseobacterium sp.]|uniref:hypothetical protein n=1 Tax=Chryseobacterium sp. TaxID=1871047 RepID=UPI00321A8E07